MTLMLRRRVQNYDDDDDDDDDHDDDDGDGGDSDSDGARCLTCKLFFPFVMLFFASLMRSQ